MVQRGGVCSAVLLLALVAAACGKKGAPLAPLHLVPAAPDGLTARRQAQDVRLRFVIPVRNVNGPGRIDLERIEVYAITLEPGGVTPPNRELLTKPYVVGAVEVKPAPVEGEPPVEGDPRPGPGDTVTFVETLTPEKMKGVTLPARAEPTPADPAAARPAAAPASAAPQTIRRIYVVRGVTRSGRPGAQSPRIEVPLTPLPPAPGAVTARSTESAIVLEWTPPVAEVAAAPYAFNVYRADASDAVNGTPLEKPTFEHADPASGVEQCFQVRSVQTTGGVAIESVPSEPACLTPRDTFAPAAPKGLATVPGPGVINLIWDANTEPDLAGYIVLRAEAPGDKLLPLTPTPIQGATFADTTVKPSVRYVYAIVAVDKANPPNASGQSERVTETAR